MPFSPLPPRSKGLVCSLLISALAISGCRFTGSNVNNDQEQVDQCKSRQQNGAIFGNALSGLLGAIPVPVVGTVGNVGAMLINNLTACDYHDIETGQIIANVNDSLKGLYNDLDQLKADLEQQNLVTLEVLDKMKSLNLKANIDILASVDNKDANLYTLLNEARIHFYDLVAIYSGVSSGVAGSKSLGYIAGVNQIYLSHAVVFLSYAAAVNAKLAALPSTYYPVTITQLRSAMLNFTANVIFLIDNIAQHRNDANGPLKMAIGDNPLIDFENAGHFSASLYNDDDQKVLVDSIRFQATNRSLRIDIQAFGGRIGSKVYSGSDLAGFELPLDLRDCPDCSMLGHDDLINYVGDANLKRLICKALELLYRHPESRYRTVPLQHPAILGSLFKSFSEAEQVYNTIKPTELQKLKDFSMQFFRSDLAGVYSSDGSVSFNPTLPLMAPIVAEP